MQTVMQAEVARITAPSAATGQTGKTKESDTSGFFSLLSGLSDDGITQESAETAKASWGDENETLQAGMALLMMLQAVQTQAQPPEGEVNAAITGGETRAGTGFVKTVQEAAQYVPKILQNAFDGMEGAAAQTDKTAAGTKDLIGFLREALQEAHDRAPDRATATADATADTAAGPKTVIERLAQAAREAGDIVARPAASLTGEAGTATQDVKTEATQTVNVQMGSGTADSAATNAAIKTANAQQELEAPEIKPDAGMQAAPAQSAETEAGGTNMGGRETAAETAKPMPAEAAIQPAIGQDASAVQADAPVRTATETTATEGNILAQLVEKATAGIKEGKHQMNIQLRPEHLGKVSVKVTMDAEGMVVKIHAQKEAAQGAISNQVAQLEQALKDRGITVVRMEVQEHLQDGAGQQRNPNDHRHGRRGYSPQDDGDAETGQDTFTTLQEYIYGNTVEFRA